VSDRLIYVENTGGLHTPDGVLLKNVDCPQSLDWEALTRTPGDTQDRQRGCFHCQRTIHNLDVMGREKILSLLHENPSICVRFTIDNPHIEFVENESMTPWAVLCASKVHHPDTDAATDTKRPLRLLVLGIGGCGINIVNHLRARGVHGVEYAAIDTSREALKRSEIPVALLIGKHRNALG
jgi:hypothetical protein